jgi:hypothetical protein
MGQKWGKRLATTTTTCEPNWSTGSPGPRRRNGSNGSWSGTCPGARFRRPLDHRHRPFLGPTDCRGAAREWPNVASAIRWHPVDGRTGAGLAPPPAFDQHHDEVLRDWLSRRARFEIAMLDRQTEAPRGD